MMQQNLTLFHVEVVEDFEVIFNLQMIARLVQHKLHLV